MLYSIQADLFFFSDGFFLAWKKPDEKSDYENQNSAEDNGEVIMKYGLTAKWHPGNKQNSRNHADSRMLPFGGAWKVAEQKQP